MRQLFALARPVYRTLRRTASSLIFERRYGVHTEEVIPLEQLGLADAERMHYRATGWLILRLVLPRRQVSDRDVFVDFGSGMGRVVLQAAMMYPFRRVVGVEISESLTEFARANLARNRSRLRCIDVSLVDADVLDFDIPDDMTVAFLYNPFVGETFRTVLNRLIESVDRNPRALRIVYGNPREEAMLWESGRVHLVRSLPGMRPGRQWSRSNSWKVFEIAPRSTTGPVM